MIYVKYKKGGGVREGLEIIIYQGFGGVQTVFLVTLTQYPLLCVRVKSSAGVEISKKASNPWGLEHPVSFFHLQTPVQPEMELSIWEAVEMDVQ